MLTSRTGPTPACFQWSQLCWRYPITLSWQRCAPTSPEIVWYSDTGLLVMQPQAVQQACSGFTGLSLLVRKYARTLTTSSTNISLAKPSLHLSVLILSAIGRSNLDMRATPGVGIVLRHDIRPKHMSGYRRGNLGRPAATLIRNSV